MRTMKIDIITCGTELLLGHSVDTNTQFLSKSLSRIGIDVFYHTTVGDNRDRLAAAIVESMERSDIVIVTGGLGPTIDDITMGTIANVANRDLVFNKKIFKSIQDYFKSRKIKLPKSAIKQSLIPRDADYFINTVGTAPGLIVEHQDKKIIALPGPPRELGPMVNKDLMPYLKKLSKGSGILKSRTIKLIGMPEAAVNDKVEALLQKGGDTTMGIYTSLGEVALRVTAKAKNEAAADKQIKRIENIIRKKFKDAIYGTDDQTLQDAVGHTLAKAKKTLAIAESCTGGHLSNLITNTSGSSGYFKMGIVAYSNDAKIKQLGIERAVIAKKGAVSKEVAKAMAENIKNISGADIGLGITGIAGPTGGSKKKPVGLVYIALSSKKKNLVKEFKFTGTREEIKLRTCQHALDLLR